MTKVLWLSDFHFTARGLVQNHNPRERLARAIGFINAHHRDAACCVISGDLVDHGTADDYAALSDALSELSVPVHPMVGNHDNRALVRKHFALPGDAMDGFLQYAVETEAARLLCLDTLNPGSADGAFCAARFAWLSDQLDRFEDRPTLLFMHHPPCPLGLPMQDQDRLHDAGPFLDLISCRNTVRYLCIGHVHRPISGSVRGVPFSTMRSVLYQAPPPEPAWDWSTFEPAVEAPQLGVLFVRDGDVTLHYQQFCRYEEGGPDA